MPFSTIPPRHLFPLFTMTSVTLMSFPAYFNTPFAMHNLFGLPQRIATSPTASSPFILMTARIQAIGIMMCVFYAKGEYAAVDTVMAILGTWVTAVDVWICLKEGVRDKAVFRGVMGGLVGLCGWMGLTAVGVSIAHHFSQKCSWCDANKVQGSIVLCIDRLSCLSRDHGVIEAYLIAF